MTVLCANPNPAIDRVAVVDFARGGTLRPVRHFEWPGGSGVHAAHVAHQLGASAEVIAILGGEYGNRFIQLATSHGIFVHPVWNAVETRSTYTLLDALEGNVCDVAEFGGVADEGVQEAFLSEFVHQVERASVCVFSGSLLKGLPSNLYAQMVNIAQDQRVPVIVDATGEALLSITQTPVFLLKASLEELVRDHVLPDEVSVEAVMSQVSHWLAGGVRNVCLSLGSAGLLWVSPESTTLVSAKPVEPFNTVGCGDALVGAVSAALDQGIPLATALEWGVAAATANLAYDAPGHCTLDDVRRLLPSVRSELADNSAVARAIAASRRK